MTGGRIKTAAIQQAHTVVALFSLVMRMGLPWNILPFSPSASDIDFLSPNVTCPWLSV